MTPERQQEIRDLSNDEWVDRSTQLERETGKTFDELCEVYRLKIDQFTQETSEPAELHYFADTFNWDDSLGPLLNVINNPACDLATAKLIFWRANPDEFQEYQSEKELEPYYRDQCNLVLTIRNLAEKGSFKKSEIAYCPKQDGFEVDDPPAAKWLVPNSLRS